jgi:lysophospholipase L1-like esterase
MLATLAAALLVPALYVGDSLGVGTAPPLTGQRVEVDARVGRTSSSGLAVLRARLRPRHRAVVFDVGTNDWSTAALRSNLWAARRTTAGRPMVVFTINKPGSAPYNATIRAFQRRAYGVWLIDWQGVAGRRHLLAGDGIHASAAGYARRAALVLRVLRLAR